MANTKFNDMDVDGDLDVTGDAAVGGDLAATGGVTGATVTATGALTGATVTATGALTGASAGVSTINLTPLAEAPADPVEGMIYCKSTDHKFYGHNGTAWVALDTQ
ncbi:MAG: hypothetical protein ABFD89_23825 [Bryobacteraceae bacterium]